MIGLRRVKSRSMSVKTAQNLVAWPSLGTLLGGTHPLAVPCLARDSRGFTQSTVFGFYNRSYLGGGVVLFVTWSHDCNDGVVVGSNL